MSIKLNAQSGGSVALDAPTQTTNSEDKVYKLPVADGSSGQVLQTDGSGNLSWVTLPTANVAFSMLDIYHLNDSKDISAGTVYYLNTDFIQTSSGTIGTGLTKSNEVFSFPSTGIYMINFRSETKIDNSQSSRYRVNAIWTTTDGGSNYTERSSNSAIPGLSNATYNMNEASYVFDVTSTTNCKFKLSVLQEVNGKVRGGPSNFVQTQLIVYKIAET